MTALRLRLHSGICRYSPIPGASKQRFLQLTVSPEIKQTGNDVNIILQIVYNKHTKRKLFMFFGVNLVIDFQNVYYVYHVACVCGKYWIRDENTTMELITIIIVIIPLMV